MIYIFPYHRASKSAWALLEALEAQGIKTRMIKLQNSNFNWNGNHFVINWGNGSCPGAALNKSSGIATNKLKTFKKLREANVSIPEFTTSLEEAQSWLQQGTRVFARTKITGSEGEGIVDLATNPNTVAPLYVKYIKKAREFRVHIMEQHMAGERRLVPFRTQEKLRKSGTAPNPIRNTSNGYIFCEPKGEVPQNLGELGVKAVDSLGLQFGAVDIIWNNHFNRGFVLEINTAPGIEGSTVPAYANAFRTLYQAT